VLFDQKSRKKVIYRLFTGFLGKKQPSEGQKREENTCFEVEKRLKVGFSSRKHHF